MRVGALVLRAFAGALAVLVCISHVVETRQAPAGRLRAAAARMEITPKPGDLTIATDSIRDPLFARVVLVDDGSACAVLVGLDLGGASTALVTDAVARASAVTGCPPDNFLVSATHTHSSSPQGLGQGAATAGMVADAIVEAARTAKARLAPARIGYGHTNVDLSVNRDLFNSKLEWRQEPNPAGSSDKTLAVVEFLGADNVPIAVYMNYAMHPINFYLSGVISADFPGEASRYIEELFDNRTVAIFSQGASGDQNPRDFRSPTTFMGQRAALSQGRGPFVQTIGAPPVASGTVPQGFNAQQASAERQRDPRREPGRLQENHPTDRRVRPHAGFDARLERGPRHAGVDRARRQRTHLGRTPVVRLPWAGPQRRRQSGARERVSRIQGRARRQLEGRRAADWRHPLRERERRGLQPDRHAHQG